ncbi:Molybdate-anion transporter [Lobulomyces angularis]|nr:Molybdate-anion transporter [Lobulomyces angularis]
MNQILTSESLSYINLILSKRSSDTDETDSKLENPMFKQGFVILVICVSVLSYLYRETKETKSELTADVELEKGDNDTTFESNVSKRFRKGAIQQIQVELLASILSSSDWLQGAYVYALYSAYGYDVQEIAILFVAGFLSSAVFGTMFGSVADKFGRKLMCLSFCIIYIGSCLTKLSDVFTILMIGRITGGIATSLLFSVFEAWMVSEFYSRGFNEELLSDIFSWQTFLNGLVAIVSGVFANTIVDFFGKGASGYVAPFMAAIVVLCISFFVISTTWKENYGKESTGNLPSSSGNSSMMDSFRVIKNDFTIFAIGSMQCFFEGAMYTFVFMWSPSLEAVNGENETLPFGIIFASFMVSIMLGSVLFRISLQNGYTHESIARR